MIYSKDTIVFAAFSTRPNGRKILDLTGSLFTRLTVLGYAGRINKRNYWWCECSCGNVLRVQRCHLNNGNSKSCGCLKVELTTKRFTTHGEGGKKISPEYRAYCSAKRRCENPNVKDYPNYGGRGIEFRFSSFDDFLAEVGRRPAEQDTLDRIDVNRHYETGNLRWIPKAMQVRNTRVNRWITIDNVTKCMAEWSETSPVSADTIWWRLNSGFCDTCAVMQPLYGKCPHRQS